MRVALTDREFGFQFSRRQFRPAGAFRRELRQLQLEFLMDLGAFPDNATGTELVLVQAS